MSDTRRDRYIREKMHSMHASYLKKQSKIGTVPRNNKDLIIQGENWYWTGHTLEEADIDLQKDNNFVIGYNRAARQDAANEYLYKLGRECFENNTPLCSIPGNYAKNDYFVRGYSEALRESLKNESSTSKRK